MPFATTSSEPAPVSIVAGYVEAGGNDRAARGDAHGAVAVRPGVEHMSGAGVGNAHQRVVRGGLKLVAKRGSLRQAIELRADDPIRGPANNGCRIIRDGWSPSR